MSAFTEALQKFAPSHSKTETAAQMVMFADVVRSAPGEFKLVPRKPEAHVTPKQAAKISGLSRPTIYRLFGAGFIDGERNSPRKIKIDLASLQSHMQATKDPEFWTAQRLERFRSVRADLCDVEKE